MATKARAAPRRRAPARRAAVSVEPGGSLLLVGVALFVMWKQGWFDALTKPGALNPTSADNLAYQGANAVGSVLTDDADFTVGGWLYDATHPSFDPTVGTVAKSTNSPTDPGIFIGAP